jgi:hypothetical protein
MLSQEDRIRLIQANRSAMLDRVFDELCRNLPGPSAEQVADEIVAMANRIQSVLSPTKSRVRRAGYSYFAATRRRLLYMPAAKSSSAGLESVGVADAQNTQGR